MRLLPSLSVDDYLLPEGTSAVRHEYVGGELYAQAGASRGHNLVAGNIFARLWNAAQESPCEVLVNDMMLRVAEDVFYYPDVLVTCDPDDTDPRFVTRPCLIVEVLSPSTTAIDRREKLLAYRRLPSLKAYVMVYQDEVRVERYSRDERGAWWQAEVLGEGRVPFPCPEVELTLADLYEGLGPVPR